MVKITTSPIIREFLTQVSPNRAEDNPCVNCGYCCKQGICGYGKYDEKKKRCIYLKIYNKKIRTYRCLKYKEIVEQEKDSEYPMFHCGCSSSLFNNDRKIVLNNIQSRSIS